MQITCSKCKKVYRINPDRIPGAVSSTRCKVCGNSIPLRPAAPRTPALPKAAVIQITCQYCSKKYTINTTSIPEGAASLKCKTCGHTITLKPGPEAAPPQPVAEKTAGQNTDTREITCLYCGKKYRIKTSSIPAGVKTTKCKACGRNLSLLPAAGLTSAFKNEILKKMTASKSPGAPKGQQVPEVPIIHTIGPPSAPVWRKPWALAAAAAVMILCIGVYYTGSKLTQVANVKLSAENLNQTERQARVQESQTSPVAAPEPILVARFDVPLLLEIIDQNIGEERKNYKYKAVVAIFRSFGLSKLQLYLYPNPEHTFLPVLLADGQKNQNLEKQLKSMGNFMRLLERLPDGSYAIKKEALPAGQQKNFPIDLYRLQFFNNTAVFAPRPLSGIFKEGQDPLRQSRIVQRMASISALRELALLSLRIPENFGPDLQKKIQSNAALQQNPQAALIAEMGGGAVGRLSELLKDVESVRIGFGLENSSRRQLIYTQQFRKEVEGRRIHQQLKSGNRNDLKVSGIAANLISLLKDPSYQHKISYAQKRLTLELGWEKHNDKRLLTALSKTAFGGVLAQETAKNTPALSKREISKDRAEQPGLRIE